MGLEIALDVLKHFLGAPGKHQDTKAAPDTPQASHVGDQYRFRKADGSSNNVQNATLGQAGCPYAKTVPTEPKEGEAKPDAGSLFDTLLSRGGTFESNPSGISNLVCDFTTLISADIFYLSSQDVNINHSTSYLDLSPLYGKDQQEQNQVRAFQGGLLKKDTFAEDRACIPPGVMVLLIMFNRFHNFAAQTIYAINERGRFTPPQDKSKDEQAKWLDEQLFQTARSITVGLYVNIILHDYMRAITNTPSTTKPDDKNYATTLHGVFNKQGLPTGTGNQVTVEYDLLYSFHTLVSQKDTKWIEETYRAYFPGKNPAELPPAELFKALDDHKQKQPSDPSQRTFAGLTRGSDGAFADADLVVILVESIEEPAGRSGANHVPDVIKPLALFGIEQARKFHVASLNEFRKFFNLAPFNNFEEINSDPNVAKNLQNLYGDVDHVELYPGLLSEEQKGGSAASSTLVQGLLSSALSLIRGDRFLTTDYTPSTLTAWGMAEIAPDYTILNGAKLFLLLLTSFGPYLPFNSTYTMLPFFTPARSKEIVTKLGIASQFAFTRPSGVTAPPIPVLTNAGLKAVLGDQKNFLVPWAPHLTSLSSFMLASDGPEAAKQKKDVGEAMYKVQGALGEFEEYAQKLGRELLAKKAKPVGTGANTMKVVDIVRDVAGLAATHFVAQLAYLPLNAPTGLSYTEDSLNKLLNDCFIYIFADSDPTKSWARRRDGDGPCAELVKAMEERVQHIIDTSSSTSSPPSGCPFSDTAAATKDALPSYGVNLVKRLLATGRSRRVVAEILSGIGVGFVANAGMLFTQMIDFYLSPANASHWATIQSLSAKPSPQNDAKLEKYVLEGYRLSNTLALLRAVAPGVHMEIETLAPGYKQWVKGGDVIFLSFVAACRDPLAYPNPNTIDLTRPLDSYIHYGYGPHQCLGKSLNLVYARGLLKVVSQLPGLQRVAGEEGVLHYTTTAAGLKMYLDREWKELSPLPSAMKLMWYGKPKTYPAAAAAGAGAAEGEESAGTA